MAIQKFVDIIAWQKSQDLAVEIYLIFGAIKDFSFKDQITRASISISNNIAEEAAIRILLVSYISDWPPVVKFDACFISQRS